MLRSLLALGVLSLLVAGAQAHDEVDEFAGVTIETTPLHGGMFMLSGAGGNMLAGTGVDGAFLVDDQFAPLHQRIRDAGVPNYFGSQRFGRGGQNLRRANELLAGRGRRGGREQRSMILSAARSQLFNQVLAARVNAGTWDRAIAGDVMSLAGSQRQFMYDAADPTIADRLARLDVHPTGPLCGRPGRALQVEADARLNEERALAEAQSWIEGLTRLGLDADRRSLRLVADGLDWSWQDNSLLLSFQLVAGAFATAVLREIVRSHDADEADPDS